VLFLMLSSLVQKLISEGLETTWGGTPSTMAVPPSSSIISCYRLLTSSNSLSYHCFLSDTIDIGLDLVVSVLAGGSLGLERLLQAVANHDGACVGVRKVRHARVPPERPCCLGHPRHGASILV